MTYILIEGTTDKSFLEALLSYMKIEKTHYKIFCLGGKNNYSEFARYRQEAYDNGYNLIILLDMDANTDIQNEDTKSIVRKIYNMSSDESMPSNVFLLPNNKDNGNLETLLENIAKHKEILDCFDSYVYCIKGLQNSNSNILVLLPKSRSYAYAEALGNFG